MKLLRTALKKKGKDLWLYSLSGSYKVRINGETLSKLNSLLGKIAGEPLDKDETFLLKKLSAHCMIDSASEERTSAVPMENTRLETVELEFSSACNLECRHCFAGMNGEIMSSAVFTKALEGATGLEAVSLVFSGGEPLFNPFFDAALRLASDRNIKIMVMTNALLLDGAKADLLKQCGTAEVVVSLDSFERYHDRIRGPGAYAGAVKGIKEAVRRGLEVHVTAMITDMSFESVPAFNKFCLEELGVKAVRLAAPVPIGRAKKFAEELHLSDERLRGLMAKYCGAAPAKAGEAVGKGFACSAARGELFISAGGGVHACHYFQNIGEALGSLREQTLTTIYSKALTEGTAACFNKASMGPCLACSAFAVCGGGCRARAKLLSGSFEGKDLFACRIHQRQGHKMGHKEHKNNKQTSQAVTVSTSAVQNAEPMERTKDTGHRH